MAFIRLSSFYLALFMSSFFISLFVAMAIGSFVNEFILKSFFTERNSHLLPLALTFIYIVFYSYKKGTFNLKLWSNSETSLASTKFLIGHLGSLFCFLGIAFMFYAHDGSGVAFVPAIIWAGIFYVKGFKELSALHKTAALK